MLKVVHKPIGQNLRNGPAFALVGLLAIIAPDASGGAQRLSILPELRAMAPVIACVDAARRDTFAEVNGCVRRAGLSLDKIEPEPKTVADFKVAVITAWLLLDGDPKRPLEPAALGRAIDYAQCIESAAYRDEDFARRTRKGIAQAQMRADAACKDHPLSLTGSSPDVAAARPDASEKLFARAVANLAVGYALEANGWFPDELRPCIRYVDGRPPSAGCAGKPQPLPVRPPPPPATTKR